MLPQKIYGSLYLVVERSVINIWWEPLVMNTLQEKWEKRATVRSRPRLVFDNTETQGYFYPISHQPLAVHPAVRQKTDDKLQFLLTQSLYKYSNDIASIETRVVNQTILMALSDRLPILLNNEQKLALYTIMVDEAYHAYVAFDAMLQIEEKTGVIPLVLPETIEIEYAIEWAHQHLPQESHNVFDVIAVCLAENTLTKDIVMMTNKEETHPFFQKMIKDHLSDESRHSGVFFKLLTYIWQKLSTVHKKAIAEILPEFLERYLGLEVQKQFDLKILHTIGFSEQESVKIFDETYHGFSIGKQHPMLKNILFILERSGMIDEIISPALKAKDWL